MRLTEIYNFEYYFKMRQLKVLIEGHPHEHKLFLLRQEKANRAYENNDVMISEAFNVCHIGDLTKNLLLAHLGEDFTKEEHIAHSILRIQPFHEEALRSLIEIGCENEDFTSLRKNLVALAVIAVESHNESLAEYILEFGLHEKEVPKADNDNRAKVFALHKGA